MSRKLVVGTRGSRLALVQTKLVLSMLESQGEPLSLSVTEIKSTGDALPDAPLANLGKGIFIKELEVALLQGRIDLAVHSLKDLPVEIAEGLSVVVVGERGDPRDVLVSKSGLALADLPSGATIGTSSPRRMAQLRAMRDDLTVAPIRGNVETRLRKANEDEYDGVVLAAAGLVRLGLEAKATQYFDPMEMVPEPGQGALAVEFRAGDQDTLRILRRLQDEPTHLATSAERAFVEALGGGCKVPIAAHAVVEQDTLVMYGMVASEDGVKLIKSRLEHTASEPQQAGWALAELLLSMGARDILKVGDWN